MKASLPEALELHEIYSESQLARAHRNVSQYAGTIAGGFSPASEESVEKIVRWANENAVTLYPFSQGKNWAFGSKLPVTENNYLLDLSRLNRILDYDPLLGTIRVQAGVTQGQVSDFLENGNSGFFLDVTGSGRDTSVIGNALERGIAYNSLRVDHVLGLDVVLGSGERIRTGFRGRIEAKVSDLYSYGIGPSWDQLFFQSNFGIVLSATYKLHPKPPANLPVSIHFSEKDLGEVIHRMRALMQRGTVTGIPHLANPYRSSSTLLPLLQPKNRDYYSKRFGPETWSGIANVTGSRKVVKAKHDDLREELAGIAHVRSYRENTIERLEKGAEFLKLRKLADFLAATRGLRGLVIGVPTDDTLGMASFHPKRPNPEGPTSELDDVNRGLLFCVPLAPCSADSAKRINELVNQFKERHQQIDWGVTFNLIEEKILEAVISLHFDHDEKRRAHEIFESLNQALIKLGYPPYRLNPRIMGILPQTSKGNIELWKKVKACCDPRGVLSPGRYAE